MVTAELAVAVPALLLVLAVALSAVQLGIDRVRCVDAAQAGARLLARGEPEAAVRAAVRPARPAGCRRRRRRGRPRGHGRGPVARAAGRWAGWASRSRPSARMVARREDVP